MAWRGCGVTSRDHKAEQANRWLDTLIGVLTPPERLTVAQWADKYRVLTKVSSAEPGRWRTSRTPYLEEILDSLTPDNGIERVCLVKATQLGGTECALNFLGYLISFAPGPIMFLNPTLDMSKRASRQRIAPMLQTSPILRDLKLRDTGRTASNSVFQKDFPGGTLVLAGTQSAVALRSMPVRYLIADELDAYPLDVDGEGEPLLLAERRTDSFAKRKKIFYCSTPGVMNKSKIEPIYNQSDKRRYLVPCKHCGHCQALEWGRMKWERGEGEDSTELDVWMECGECGGRIDESDKTDFLAAGKWVAEQESEDPALRGYHLNSLYSPIGWLSWRSMVMDWLDAMRESDRRNYEKHKTFVNTRLALSWDDAAGEGVNDEALYKHQSDYSEVPAGAYVLTAGVDVQKDRLEVEVVAWGEGEESWSMDWKLIEGAPTDQATWDRLDEYLRTPFEHAAGIKLRIVVCLIDSGYETRSVYAYVGPRQIASVYAAKGIGGEGRDIFWYSQSNRQAIRRVNIGVDEAKKIVYRYLRITEPGRGYCHFPNKPAYNVEYFKQLTAEKHVRKLKRGFEKWEWIKTRDRNEALDCRVLAYVGMLLLNPRWADLRDRMDEVKRGLIEAATVHGGV